IVAVKNHAAAIGAREAAEEIEERGFPASRGADYADELAFLHGEGDAAKRLHLDLAYVVGLAQVFCFDECFGHAWENLTRTTRAQARQQSRLIGKELQPRREPRSTRETFKKISRIRPHRYGSPLPAAGAGGSGCGPA